MLNDEILQKAMDSKSALKHPSKKDLIILNKQGAYGDSFNVITFYLNW